MFQSETMGTSSTAGIVSLKAYIQRAGISTITGWRWRKKGWLKTVNIAGREYIRSEDIAEFERRAAAGEFSRELSGAAKRSRDGKTTVR